MATVFVGRGEALAVLRTELDVAAAGSSRVVWIEGEAGIGKSSLVRRFLDTMDEGRVVVWAGGAEEERLLPFGVVGQLGLGWPRRRDGEGLVQPGSDSDPLSVGAQLLGALGDVNTVSVVVIDDLQWADAESASALLFALRRVQREALLVILVTRPHPARELGDGWARLFRDDQRVRRIRIDGLRADDLVELAAVTAGRTLSSAGAARLHEHTGGHPMHARALLEEVGITALDTMSGVLPAPRSLATIILAKVATLPPPAQDLLTALAVLGNAAPLAMVAALGGVSAPVGAVEAAGSVGLVERSYEGDVRFPHPLIRGAVYNDMPATQRRDLHLAAAAATSGLVALEHRVAAADGPDVALASELEALGSQELAEDRAALAERHFQAAAQLCSAPADRDRCVLLAVEAVALGGALDRMRQLRTVVEACRDTPQRSYILGGVEIAAGRMSRAAELFAVGVGDVGVAPDAAEGWRARAAGSLAIVSVVLGRWEAALGPAQFALEHDPSSNTWARYAMTMCLAQFGQLDKIETVIGDRDEPQGAVLGGVVKVWFDDLTGGVAELETAVRAHRAGRTPRLLVIGLIALSEAQYRLGRWDDAIVSGELAVSLARDQDQVISLQPAHAVASYVHAGRGDFSIAEEHVDAVSTLVELVPSWGGSANLILARAALAQARDDALGLRRVVDVALDDSVRRNLEGVNNWPWRVLVAETFLAAGEFDRARRTLDGLDRLIARWHATSPTTDAARLRGLLMEAEGEQAAARSMYEAALAEAGALALPKARLQIAYGRWLRHNGAKRAAIDQLRAARQGLATLGARAFFARCDDELTACGVAPKRGHADAFGLTGTELTVAHLVAQGLSNREAAARLYVSAKAVEFHLGNIYAKLGIASRRQLASRLTEGAAT